jgi:hypothetical protein
MIWDPEWLPDAAEFDAFRWARAMSRFGDGDRAARRRWFPPHPPPGQPSTEDTEQGTDPDSPGDAGPWEPLPVTQPDARQEATRP